MHDAARYCFRPNRSGRTRSAERSKLAAFDLDTYLANLRLRL